MQETKLRKHRKKAGISINRLAKLSGLSYTLVWRADIGLKGVGIESKKKIADALGTDIVTLFPEVLQHLKHIQMFIPKD